MHGDTQVKGDGGNSEGREVAHFLNVKVALQRNEQMLQMLLYPWPINLLL
jgi:hypothetical protein